MQRILIAIRAFFAAIFSAEASRRIQQALSGTVAEAVAEAEARPLPKSPAKPPAEPKAVRSDAIALLAALQREARFVDFVMEPLDEYSDAQVGAAARDVHRQCRVVIERLFALRPVLEQSEGQPVEVPPGFDPSKYRLTGQVSGNAPFRGRLVHHGWTAARCEVPSWSGSKEAALVVAPAEVEVDPAS